MSKIRKAVAAYDLHYPEYSKSTWNAILDYLRKNKIDVFIFGGDQFHFEEISHHTKNQPLYRVRRGYRNSIEGFERDILTPLEKVLSRGCEKVWITGNHERFEWDLVEEHPELEDTINHVRNLRLLERGWNVIPLGHGYRLGKLNVIHGETLSGIGNQTTIYTAKKAVELYAGNVLAGHTHAPQSYTRISPVDFKSKWQAWIAPCVSTCNPNYLRNRPSAWMNGMVIIEVQSNGNFNLFSINIPDGKFCYGGKLYGGK